MNRINDVDNVFLIVADSLRYDTATSTMRLPGRLVENGEAIIAENCYTPGAGTPSSMPGIMQSRLPIEHGGYGLTLPPEPPTLAEWLSDADIRCIGLHSNSYTTADAGFDRGFDVFADLSGFGDDGYNIELDTGDMNENKVDSRSQSKGWRTQARQISEQFGVRNFAERIIEPVKRWGYLNPDPRADGEDLFETTRDWLTGYENERTFTWLQLMDTHLPYLPPEKYRPDSISYRDSYDLWQALTSRAGNLSEAEIDNLYRLYNAEVRYVDDMLSEFVNWLKSTGRWESSVIVFTGDHGELFNDRAVPGDDAMKHPNYLCEELTHVPLMIAGGAVKDSETITDLVNGIDLAPTIASLFGLDSSEQWRGDVIGSESHANREQIVSAISHTRGSGVTVVPDDLHVAVRTNDHALLWWRNGTETEFYRRTSDGEIQIENPDQEAFAHLRETAEGMISHVDEMTDEGDVGGDVSKRLKDLGYVE